MTNREAPGVPRRYPTMPAKERALWARHLQIKDALASAALKGDLRGVRKLEEEMKSLLEFHNGEEADRWRSFPVLAVCDAAAVDLLERSRREVFGITTLGGRIPWGCAPSPAGTESPMEKSPEEPRKESRRGKHRNPRSLANLIPNARGSSAGKPHSFRAESAREALV